MSVRLLESAEPAAPTTGQVGGEDIEALLAELKRLTQDVNAGRAGPVIAAELSATVGRVGGVIERFHGRLDQILQAVTSMTALDFGQQIELQEDDDWVISALVIGLNMMSDELRRRSDDLTETRDRALAASKAKTAFLANMSHELRTPLNAILGYSEMLREESEGTLSSDQLADLDRIVGAGRHLLSLIQDTLDLSKIEAGKVELVLRTFEVDRVVDEVVGTVAALAESRGNRLVVERGHGLGSMTSDRTKLVQILFNLLSNAIKFTTFGTVRFAVDRGGDSLVFAVQDTGIGIPGDKLDLVFGAFNQVDAETTRRYGGTGLGLTITRHFSEMMGGEIAVTSELGAGSTFTLRLPANAPTNNVRRGRGEVVRAASPELVLVVTEDARLVEVLRQTLAARGAPVLAVANGDAGLHLAAQLRPAVLVLDDRVHDPDLATLLLSLASDPEVSAIPRVVVGQLPAQDFARGAAQALPRPLRVGAVQAALRPYLRVPAPLGELLLVLGPEARTRLGPELFAERGWQVRSASCVTTLRERLAAGYPDAVVFDLDMSDAREIAEALRWHPGGRGRVVIGIGDGEADETTTPVRGRERSASGVCTAVLPLSCLGTLLETLTLLVYAAGSPGSAKTI